MNKSILLASFVERGDLYIALEKISKMCKLSERGRIFTFINENDNNEYILTYNLYAEYANIKFTSIWENTISIHRKKQTNTLYSLNAMNELIKSKNWGRLDKSYRINWEDYENSFLIIKNGKLKIIPIRMVKINH
jgi:hypothetical protein